MKAITSKTKAKSKPLTADQFRALLFGDNIPEPTWTAKAHKDQADLMSLSPEELIRYFENLLKRTDVKEQTPQAESKIASKRKPQAKDWLTLKEGQHRLRLCPPNTETGLPYFKIERDNKTEYLWNVVNRADGKLYVWSTTEKLFEAVVEHARFSPICDADKGNDLILTTSGEGSRRRYSAPLCIPQSCPLGYNGELFNLIAAAAQ